MYCAVCAAYGHTNGDCPNKVAWAVRSGKSLAGVKNLELRVKNTEQGMRSMLIEHGITPGSKHMENRKLLRDLANTMTPLRLILFVDE
jgi:hypothetical protein